jgi:hypothetical protein
MLNHAPAVMRACSSASAISGSMRASRGLERTGRDEELLHPLPGGLRDGAVLSRLEHAQAAGGDANGGLDQ